MIPNSVQQKDTNNGRIFIPQVTGNTGFGGIDDPAHWETIPHSCKAMVIGPRSDVSAVRVCPANFNGQEFLLAVGAPMIGESPDLEFHGPILIKPFIVTAPATDPAQTRGYTLDVVYYRDVPSVLPMKRAPFQRIFSHAVAGPFDDTIWVHGRKKTRVWVLNFSDRPAAVSYGFTKWMPNTGAPATPQAAISLGVYGPDAVPAAVGPIPGNFGREFCESDLAKAGALVTGADMLVVSISRGGGSNNAEIRVIIETED